MTYFIVGYLTFSIGLQVNAHSQNSEEYCRQWRTITKLGPVTLDVWFVIMNTAIFNIFPSLVIGVLFGPIILLRDLVRK
jgi:hypothetical protein